ncbi:11445_t:CDS:2, partial [Gigaspora rosea]
SYCHWCLYLRRWCYRNWCSSVSLLLVGRKDLFTIALLGCSFISRRLDVTGRVMFGLAVSWRSLFINGVVCSPLWSCSNIAIFGGVELYVVEVERDFIILVFD